MLVLVMFLSHFVASKSLIMPIKECDLKDNHIHADEVWYPKRILEDVYGHYYFTPPKCHTMLQKLLQCTGDYGYTYHELPFLRSVREKWLVCGMMGPRVDRLLDLINVKLPAALDAERLRYKSSGRFEERYNADVLRKMEDMVAGTIQADVKRMEEVYRESAEVATKWSNTKQSLFTKALIDLLQKAKDQHFVDQDTEDMVLGYSSPPPVGFTDHQSPPPVAPPWGFTDHQSPPPVTPPWGFTDHDTFATFHELLYGEQAPPIRSYK